MKKTVIIQTVFLFLHLSLVGWMVYMWIDCKEKKTVMIQCAREKPCMDPTQLGLIIRYLENLITIFNKFI